MAITRLSLSAIKNEIDSIVDSITTRYATMVNEVYGNTTSTVFSGDAVPKLNALYDLINAETPSADSTDAIEDFIGASSNSSLETDYNSMKKIADAIIDIKSKIGIGQNIDSRFDTLAEIVTEIITHQNDFNSWVDSKFEKSHLIIGNSFFNKTDSSTGTTHITATIPTADYSVSIMPIAPQGGYLGEIYVLNKTQSGFDVVCTGTATTGFDYAIICPYTSAPANNG